MLTKGSSMAQTDYYPFSTQLNFNSKVRLKHGLMCVSRTSNPHALTYLKYGYSSYLLPSSIVKGIIIGVRVDNLMVDRFKLDTLKYSIQ